MSNEATVPKERLEKTITTNLIELDTQIDAHLNYSADRCKIWAVKYLRDQPIARMEHKIRTKLEESIENTMVRKVDDILNQLEETLAGR